MTTDTLTALDPNASSTRASSAGKAPAATAARMKAVVYHRYGGPDVVALADVPKPVARDNEVLVRIHATTVSTGDWRARTLNLPGGFGFLGRPVFGFFGPRQPILGTEFAGTIESVGKAVTRFRPGDDVFGFTGAKYGCHAEYRTMPEDGMLTLKPENLSFEEAASLSFGATTALSLLRDKARVQPGETVLVVGASGAVGSAAVQIAKYFGADVTAVTSTGNIDLVRTIGATHAIDYKHEDFAAGDETWDVILDTTGTTSFARCERVLNPGGRLVIVQGTLADAMGLTKPPKGSDKSVIAALPKITAADIAFLGELATSGALRPVIDRTYRLDQAATAHAYVETGRKRGSVVLSVTAEDDADQECG
jgi:NADPH:quinone reductase-like Zn-dependent oxidoreductase